jgi:hypothetical protein
MAKMLARKFIYNPCILKRCERIEKKSHSFQVSGVSNLRNSYLYLV